MATTGAADEPGWEWMAVEIMGHRSHAGRTREEERFGAKMLRIDVPVDGDPAKGWHTHYYSGSAIFGFRLIDRDTALAANKPYEPPARFALAGPADADRYADHHDDTGGIEF